MTRACRNCQWWKETDVPHLKGLGRCRGAPPTSNPAGFAVWPLTNADDWCGAFRMAEAVAAGEPHTDVWSPMRAEQIGGSIEISRLAGGVTDAEFEDAHKRMAERLEAVGAKKETKQ